jgi:hypothetical protein
MLTLVTDVATIIKCIAHQLTQTQNRSITMFKMSINLGNVKPSQPLRKDLITGVYKCKITKMEGKNPVMENGEIVNYKRGMWVFQVIDGDYDGSTCLHSMNTPKDANDWIARLWVDSLLSCQYDIEEIADMPAFDETVFVGRECFIQYTDKSDNGGTYDKVRFIKSEEDYIMLKERGVSTVAKKEKAKTATSTAGYEKIAVSEKPDTKDLSSLISGIGDVGF